MLDERLPYLEVKNISDLLDLSDSLDLFPANGTSQDITALIDLVKNVDSADVCFVKTVKRDTTIPNGSIVKVPCKANTGMLNSNVQVVFEPDEEQT